MKAPGNTKTSYLKSGTILQKNLFQYDTKRYYSLRDVSRAIERGIAYVSVNTDDGFDEENTKPGNYIMGELRGQINRDCASKCECGIKPNAVNSIGAAMTLKIGLSDLFRGA
eukprot:NODE_563_length_5987_cov_2.002717.p7 type:complete len:112 gc:universal NODE_563_length_5987_cov_2.002717:3435-3770(+)